MNTSRRSPKASIKGSTNPQAAARAHREAGVTAIEITVVLAIIGVVALSTIPKVQDLLEASRAKGATEQVAGTMRLGRQYAIGSTATYGVSMTATTLSVACNALCPPTQPSEPTATVLHGATLVSGDGESLATPVLFGSTGGAVAPAGAPTGARQVIVRYANGTVVVEQRVCVSAAGRIVVTAPGEACP